MKITKSQLKQIIKEELENALNEKYLVGQWPFDSQSLDRGREHLSHPQEKTKLQRCDWRVALTHILTLQ